MKQCKCSGCRKVAMCNTFTRSVVRRIKGRPVNVEPGEYCGDCFDRLLLADLRPRMGRDHATQHLGDGYDGDGSANGGSFDDTVRAYEEDR